MVKKDLSPPGEPLDYSYEEAFDDYNRAFDHVNDLWGLPETLKCHIMGSHVVEYFVMEGATCWSTSEVRGLESLERCLRTGFNIHNLKSFRKA